MIITSITKVKGMKQAVQVRTDCNRSFLIPKTSLDVLGIKPGSGIDNRVLEKIESVAKILATDTAWDVLKHRQLSTVELDQLLSKYGFSRSISSSVIAKLKEMKYLDDTAFARNTAEKLSKQLKGRNLLIHCLEKKGISNDIIKALISEMQAVECENIMKLALTKLKKIKGVPANSAMAKLAAFLGSRGFEQDTVTETVERIMNIYEEKQ